MLAPLQKLLGGGGAWPPPPGPPPPLPTPMDGTFFGVKFFFKTITDCKAMSINTDI